MTARSFALTVPGAESREYDFYTDFQSQSAGVGLVHPADIFRSNAEVLRTLSEEFDEFRGLADAGTSYRVDGFDEIPDGMEDDPNGFAYTVVYLHPNEDIIWGDDTICLRAAIDPDGGIQDLRYGYNAFGIWSFISLAE